MYDLFAFNTYETCKADSNPNRLCNRDRFVVRFTVLTTVVDLTGQLSNLSGDLKELLAVH